MRAGQLIFLFFIGLMMLSCSKENEQPLITLFDHVTDSIIKAEGLKFTDTAGLRITGKFFRDSTNSVYLHGERNGKFWFGVFTEKGVRLFDKTYSEDTDTLNFDNGEILKLDTSSVRVEKQIGGVVYFIRHRRSRDGDEFSFKQIVLAYNISERKVTDRYYTYNGRQSTGEMCVLHIIPWTKGHILVDYGEATRYTPQAKAIAIADKNLKIIEFIKEVDYGRVEFPLSPLCIPVSDYDFVKVISKRVFRKSIKSPDEKWHIIVSPRLPDDVVSLKSYFLSENILDLTFTQSTKVNGVVPPPSTVQVDIELGREIK